MIGSRSFRLTISVVALLLQVGYASAAQIAFIGCPVVRDIALPELPCWLGKDGDKLYYLGPQTDTIPPIVFSPPQLLHRILVEGEITSDQLVCGAPAIENVQVSVLPDIAPECNTILPQAGYHPPPATKIVLPLRKGTRLATVPAPGTNQFIAPRPAVAVAPFSPRSYRIDYGFGEDFLFLNDSRALTEAAWFVNDVNAKRIVIEAHRDRVTLTNGTIIEEGPEVATRRAERIRSIFLDWGIAPGRIVIQPSGDPVAKGRYLTLTVQP